MARSADEMTSAERTALYRTLAHPLRGRILQHLGTTPEVNSTALAEVLGESTGTTSYHLRKLAESGLIAEIPEKSQGRERWWRAVPFEHTMPDPATMAPGERAAAEELAELRIGRDFDLYRRVVREWSGPGGWAQLRRAEIFMTAEQWHEFITRYQELLNELSASTRGEAPAAARAMSLRFFGAPCER